jgi:hypothetical protein
MTPADLAVILSDLPPDSARREFVLTVRIAAKHIAPHVPELRLNDGQRLNDATDFAVFLSQLSDELAQMARTVPA